MFYRNSWPELIRPLNPAAGQPLQFRIPGETFAMVSHCSVLLTTSAVVADRYGTLDFLSGDGGLTFVSISGTAHAASLTRRYSFAPSVVSLPSVPSGHHMIPIPSSLLPPGFVLSFNAFGLQAGDQFSDAYLYLLRVPSGDSPSATGSMPYPA